jgi:hypothetical protein
MSRSRAFGDERLVWAAAALAFMRTSGLGVELSCP